HHPPVLSQRISKRNRQEVLVNLGHVDKEPTKPNVTPRLIHRVAAKQVARHPRCDDGIATSAHAPGWMVGDCATNQRHGFCHARLHCGSHRSAGTGCGLTSSSWTTDTLVTATNATQLMTMSPGPSPSAYAV